MGFIHLLLFSFHHKISQKSLNHGLYKNEHYLSENVSKWWETYAGENQKATQN